MSEADPAAHYAALGSRYEEGAFYDLGSAYNRWLVPQVGDALGLQPNSRLVDVGGATGAFTEALAEAASLTTTPLVVEPSPLGEQARERGLEVLQGDALDFARSERQADALLLKEVVHHIPTAQLSELCAGLAERIAPGGRVLIVTRPVEPDYPLFAAAREVWRQNQPPAETYAAPLRAAGFGVEVGERAYPFEIPRDEWVALIRRRFWSTFSAFDDAALEAGVRELEESHLATLRFADRLVFLSATR